MSLKQNFVASILIGSAALTAISPAQAKGEKMEKCYGVVKAGKNDCADTKQTHSCAGAAKSDGSQHEWILLPKGTCEKIVNGVLKA